MKRSLRLAAVALCVPVPAAMARDLNVGLGEAFRLPSQAVAVAVGGDRVLIAPDRYQDCAVLTADDITIEGRDPGKPAVLSTKLCDGKPSWSPLAGIRW